MPLHVASRYTYIENKYLTGFRDYYYPFGMTMHGLSSAASMAKANNYMFNAGTELTADFGWEMYDTMDATFKFEGIYEKNWFLHKT